VSEQLSRIENKIDKIEEHILELKEGRAAVKARIEGHATQLGLLWTMLILSIGGIITAFFKL